MIKATNKGKLVTDFYIINEFNALIASNLLMSKEDQVRNKENLHVDFYEEVVLSDSTITKGSSWVVKPKNEVFSAIRFYSKFKFTETEYQIANMAYAIIGNKLTEYQEQELGKNFEFDFDIRNKKSALLNNWFSISVTDIRKTLGGSYKRESIKRALYKLMSIQMEIKFDEGNRNDSVFISGILSSSIKFSEHKIDFQVSGYQQLLFKEAFRNDMFYKVKDSVYKYHSRNFDYMGLNNLTSSQKQIIFYLAERFEIMHKLKKDKTITLNFSSDQIVGCRNFNIYEWLEKEYTFDESKVRPEHKDEHSKEKIKAVLKKRHKNVIYKISKDFKKNIISLSNNTNWNHFFKLSKDKKSVVVHDFTRMTSKVKYNPCKRISSQSIF